MANKTKSEKNKPTRKTLRADEYHNSKTKRYEYHYKDALGKERVEAHIDSNLRINYQKVSVRGKVYVKRRQN